MSFYRCVDFSVKVASSEYLYVCTCPALRKSGKGTLCGFKYARRSSLLPIIFMQSLYLLSPILWLLFCLSLNIYCSAEFKSPSLSCTAYSLLRSDSLFTPPICFFFFYTNHQFSLTHLLYSITHCDFVLLFILPLCVVGHHCCPCLSVFVGKWAKVGIFMAQETKMLIMV